MHSLRDAVVSFETDVLATVRHSLRERSGDAFHLIVEPDAEEGLVIRVQPRDPECAAIAVHVEWTDHVDLVIGQATRFELQDGEPTALLARLERILRAVVDGSFVEKVWYRDADVLKARARLLIEGTTVRTNYRHLLGLVQRHDRVVDKQYAPYR